VAYACVYARVSEHAPPLVTARKRSFDTPRTDGPFHFKETLLLTGRRKLLLADDSPTVRKVVELFFGEEGYDVVAVGGGEEALRELEGGRPPDVLLADVVMPGPNGYELCERVKRDSRFSRVPVVLLVGTFEPFNEAEARRVGADTVLTKPFQSIRDLVSKVGSLLGGEPKHVDEQSPHEERHAGDERPEASAPPDDAARGAHVEARGEDSAQAFDADAASPYVDLGADDELIEAKPADAFITGSAYEDSRRADEHAQTPHDTHAQTSHDAEAEREQFVAHDEQPSEEFSGAHFGAREYEHAGANGHTPSAAHAASPFVTPSNYAEDNSMPAQPSFDARAASAAAADDTLLDLGQFEPHAGAVSAVAEADDFILDLDDEMPSHAVGAVALDDAMVLDEPGAHVEEALRPDAPSAFAEAAHGEHVASFSEPLEHFSESSAPLSESSESFSEPAVPFAASAHSFSEDASANSSSENEYMFDAGGIEQPSFEHSAPESAGEFESEFVMQDGPQGFASYVAPEGVGTALRGYVEPEVVPADVPTPAVVEGEFTDGSVEGDVPKAPAVSDGPHVSEATHDSEVMQSSDSHASQPLASHVEPSTAGYVVSEGHTRVEEPARAGDQLSPEAIDAIARRVVELMSDKVVREIAWEVVPDLAELLIKQKLEEGQK
jgi:CheY-like chemotaxis protein